MKMTPEMVQRDNDYLFASVEEMREAGIQERIIERLLRIRAIYTYRLNRPQLNDREIVAEMVKRYKLATRTAYDDLALIKTVLGSLNQCSQDYLRWVFLQRCEEGFEMARNMDDYESAMAMCREVQRQLHSRLLHDASQYQDDLMQLSLRDIRSRELGGSFLNGCTGLYFMVSMDEPTELCYNPEEWNT